MLSQSTISFIFRNAYEYASHKSTDPRTQNGAVLVSQCGQELAYGTNHYVHDSLRTPETLEPPAKYAYVEHAERDVIFNAAKEGIVTNRTILVVPWACCPDCARAIVLAGITQVITHASMLAKTPERWQEPIEIGKRILAAGKVQYRVWEGKVGGVKVLFNGELWQP